jgi:hypothetical protein
MNRREFIGLLGGAALSWPDTLRAQQSGHVLRVGMLLGISVNPYTTGVVDTFRAELKEQGTRSHSFPIYLNFVEKEKTHTAHHELPSRTHQNP